MGRANATREPMKVGSFEIVREIGQGGMGVIYLARQPALDRLVVLKKMRRDLLSDSSMLSRFQLEARTAAAVHHQNVVAVYNCFPARGTHFIAQEYVDGIDLSAILEKTRKLSPFMAGLIGLEIVRGLEEIHARGIVHRDLKPANVLVGTAGEVKIADFGIAFDGGSKGLTLPGTMVGSLPYMSPEQMLGKRVDTRSDLFSFGVLLYEMVTGVPPFKGSEGCGVEELLRAMQIEGYESPRRRERRTPLWMARLIRSCLRPKPARRPQTATLVRLALERRLGTVSPADCRGRIAAYLWERGVMRAEQDRTARRTAHRPPRLRDASLRWALPAVGSAAALLLAVALSLFGAFSGHEPDEAATRDEALLLASTPRDRGDSNGAINSPPVETAPGDDATSVSVLPCRARPSRHRFPSPHRLDAQVFASWPIRGPKRELRKPAFHTPRAEPISLEHGHYDVVFEHPTYGRAEYALDLAEGWERVLRHAFAEVHPHEARPPKRSVSLARCRRYLVWPRGSRAV